MDLIKLTEELVCALATNKEKVLVKELPSDDKKTIFLQVLVDKADMSRIIGKDGKVINAIRTLVQASASFKEKKRININIDNI